jgi:hypothetical protein
VQEKLALLMLLEPREQKGDKYRFWISKKKGEEVKLRWCREYPHHK